MKIVLLYFTGTGMTGKLVSVITEEIEKLNISVEQIRMKKRLKFSAEQYDIIGVSRWL